MAHAGHSLGGGLAACLGLHMLEVLKDRKDSLPVSLRIMTFGAPLILHSNRSNLTPYPTPLDELLASASARER